MVSVAVALEAAPAETQHQNEVERSRLEMMRRYAEHSGCSPWFLLSYCGQDYRGPCRTCGNDLTNADVPFAVGARVASERWREGTVQRHDGDR